MIIKIERHTDFSIVEYGLMFDNSYCLYAESLIDVTHNTVEQFNNVTAKLIDGKIVHFNTRGLYQATCFGAVISWNSEKAIQTRIHKIIQGYCPSKFTMHFIRRSIQKGVNKEN